MTFIGIDGCRAGWLGLALGEGDEYRWRLLADEQALAGFIASAKQALIDIPIGLVAAGPHERICDKAARRILGAPRAASVFPAPARPSLEATGYDQAQRINRALTGRGLSRQSWAIAPRIRQIDELLRTHPHLRGRLRESHPEVCFWALNHGVPMVGNKKTPTGRKARLAVLARHYPGASAIVETVAFSRRQVAPDDVVDALVLAVTARLGARRLASLPENPPTDERGLPMEIVYPRCSGA